MCGIVGYAGFAKRVSLDKAIGALKHRGPDDSGVAYFDELALGNTRLSIIDLSKKGHQPMFNRDRSLCIIFNGELYNFADIKRKLEKKYPFTSHSDTEVVLYSYKEWGTRCLEKFNGMFAFVIYDRKKNLLFCARDPLGQKPFKYYFKNCQFIFASEIKAILQILGFKPGIDPIAIDDFLTLQYVPSPKTGFKDIYKLPPGHYCIYKDKKLSIRRYWSVDFSKKRMLSKEEWEEDIYLQMQRSVSSHMVSDVPVGALLSGGLDSSIVVALMSKVTRAKIHTFTIAFDNDRFDESPYAQMVSDIYDTNHRQFLVHSHDFLKHIEGLSRHFDEPLGDNSIFPMYLVSQLTSKYVKVALTGDGGDENFAGYDRYTYVCLRQLLSKIPVKPVTLTRFFSDTLYSLKPSRFTDRARRFISSIGGEFYKKYILYNSFFLREGKQSLYTNDFKHAVAHHDTGETYKKFYDARLEDVENALRIDMNTYLPDDLLYKSDTASMAHSLELRAPFLDHELLEKTASMPYQYKLDLWGNKKKMLKTIAYRYNLIPKEIIFHPKQGFVVPLDSWLRGPLQKPVTDTILSSSAINSIFEKNKLEQYMRGYYTRRFPYANNMFSLLMLSLWLNTYA